MAHRVGSLRRTNSVAIEGIADIRRSLAARRSDANGPKGDIGLARLKFNFSHFKRSILRRSRAELVQLAKKEL